VRAALACDVTAAAGIGWRIDDAVPPLRDAVKQACGVSVRRVNRLIQLALIGACRCASGRRLDPGCGLYLASGQGALQDSVDVFTQMFVDGQAPKPISFVNTLSNTACFYVAKILGLEGPNQFVSASTFPLESALSLALLDLARGRVQQALVGGVDECVLPLADHRKRLRTEPDAPLGEGSHWLLLEREATSAPIGRLHYVREFPDEDALTKWLGTLPIAPESWARSFGSGIAQAERVRLAGRLPLAELDYRPRDAYYETITGAGLCTFLLPGEAADSAEAARSLAGRQTLLHVNASTDRRYAACVLERSHG